MSNGLIALFFAVGIGGWVYYQLQRRMSANMKAVWIATAATALIAYFVFYTTFAWIIDGS